MIQVEHLQQEDFKRFPEREIRSYAADHVRNGNWPEEGALERSKQEFEHYLPDGIHSKDQYLYSLVDEPGNKIGMLWVRVKEQKAFIFNFVIDESLRGKGFGRQSLAAMEEKTQKHECRIWQAVCLWGYSRGARVIIRRRGLKLPASTCERY